MGDLTFKIVSAGFVCTLVSTTLSVVRPYCIDVASIPSIALVMVTAGLSLFLTYTLAFITFTTDALSGDFTVPTVIELLLEVNQLFTRLLSESPIDLRVLSDG